MELLDELDAAKEKLVVSNDPNASRDEYDQRIRQVMDYINRHLNKPLLLDDLAAEAGFSAYHFHRIFSAMVGETPADYVNRLRLERAANQLLKGRQPVTDIAMACGFSSPAVFARGFKQHFGVSASHYRRDRGQTSRIGLHPMAQSERHLPIIDVHVCERDPVPVIFAANMQGYKIEKICEAWTRLRKWASVRGLINPQTRAIGVSFDDPAITPANRCQYFACLSVPHKITTNQRIGFMEIAGGLYAVGRAACAQEEIRWVYAAMFGEWLPSSGYQPAVQPPYEVYLQTPETHPEGCFEIEICIPVVEL